MSLSAEEREELVRALKELDGSFSNSPTHTPEEANALFEKATWSALCHVTGRAAKFYMPDDSSPEARIYRLMGKAFGQA